MANKYVGAAQFVGEKIIKPIVKSFTKKQKTTGKTTNPFERKKMRSDRAAKIGQLKVDLAKLKGGSKKLQTSIDEVRAAMRDRAKGKKRVYSGKELEQQEYFKYKKDRVKKMGGGMMGRRMGYKGGSNGSKKGKIPTTPKEKSLAKLAPPRNRITFGDVVAGRTKGKA